MSNEQDIHKLTEYFRAWGVRDPEGWARSQVNEDIPQYARLVFLKGAWQTVIDDGNTSWIDHVIDESKRHPRAPYGPLTTRVRHR